MGCYVIDSPALVVPELSLGVWNHLTQENYTKGAYFNTTDNFTNMTLFNLDDDQMVPQVTLGVSLNVACSDNASPAPALTLLIDDDANCDTLNTPTLVKPIPDFESLLTGLNGGDQDDDVNSSPPELSWSEQLVTDSFQSMYPMAETGVDSYRALGSGEPVHEQDLTFYDDHPMVSIKQEKYSPQDEYPPQQPAYQQAQQSQAQQQQQAAGVSGNQALLPMEEDSAPPHALTKSDETQNDIDAVTKEIDGVCSLLNIPVSPYQWTVEQVTKWASWTLDQYNLPSWYLSDLKIDGTTLCLLPPEEFKTRWPMFGEYLYAQLEVWKGAYYNIKAEASPTELYDEAPTYLNLEPAGHATAHSTSHQQHHQQHHHHHHHAQLAAHQHHQHHHHQQAAAAAAAAQPAFIPMTGTSTSPTPSPCHSSSLQQPPPHYGSDPHMMLSSLSAIPKPVLTPNLVCGSNLSPASSLDSMDSFASSPASETEYDRSFGGASLGGGQQDPRPEVTPSKQNIHLWQFLRELLIQQHNYGSAIRWLDRAKGIFKIEDSARVARLWGQRKNRPAMNYDKLSRSIRQYYKKGIIKKTDNSKRLVYQFCPQYRV